MLRRSRLAGIALLATLCGPAFADDVAKLPWLKIAGAQVVNADTGQPVRLRGVCLDRFYFSYEDDPKVVAAYCDKDDIDRLAGDGVTLVRIGFHPLEVLGPPETVKRDLQRLDELVAACAAAKIYVVLDLHLPPGNHEIDPLDGAFWDDPKHGEEILSLWKTLAQRFKDQSAVLGYDLFNEPTPDAEDAWWKLADRLIDAVRSVDPRHILVLEPPLIEDAGLRKVKDPQTLYSFHFYEPFLFSHQGTGFVGDVPLPAGVAYPGAIPMVEEHGTVNGPSLRGEASEWTKLESAETEAPKGAIWLAVGLSAEGEVGQVWFDDLALTEGAQAVAVPNPGFEAGSEQQSDLPKIWRPDGEDDGEPIWAKEAHTGARSLSLKGVKESRAWINWDQAIPAYYVPVQEGKRYKLSVWVKTQGSQGEVGASFFWLGRKEEKWDHARLEQALQATLAWGKDNGVALYCGEFGATRAGGTSQAAYLSDVAAILNAAGVPWTMWTFRDPEIEADAGAFGLYYGPDDGGTKDCKTNQDLYAAFRKALK